jgi:hypothetical protein
MRSVRHVTSTQYTELDSRLGSIPMFDLPCIDVSDVVAGRPPSDEVVAQVCEVLC